MEVILDIIGGYACNERGLNILVDTSSMFECEKTRMKKN